jgi:hypothetical protein
MKIYLDGPLFTTAEQEFNRRLRKFLENAGHKVWLPQEHEPRKRSTQATFETDITGPDGASGGGEHGRSRYRLWHLLGMRLRAPEKAHHSFPHRLSRGRRRPRLAV